MSTYGSYASGGTRRGPGGRKEVWFGGKWTPEADLSDEQRREAMRPPQHDEPGEPVRTKVKGPTDRQREIWEAVVKHGGRQTAAAEALGITQGGVSSAVKGYMKAMERAGTPVELPEPSKVGRYSPADRHLPEKAEPLPIQELEPVMDEPEEAPGEPEATLTEWRRPPPLPYLPELPEIPELPELTASEELATLAHQRGYAEGFAAAALRAMAALTSNEALRDVANDAADGLMS